MFETSLGDTTLMPRRLREILKNKSDFAAFVRRYVGSFIEVDLAAANRTRAELELEGKARERQDDRCLSKIFRSLVLSDRLRLLFAASSSSRPMSRAERERHVSSRLHRGAAATMTPDGNPRMVSKARLLCCVAFRCEILHFYFVHQR